MTPHSGAYDINVTNMEINWPKEVDRKITADCSEKNLWEEMPRPLCSLKSQPSLTFTTSVMYAFYILIYLSMILHYIIVLQCIEDHRIAVS